MQAGQLKSKGWKEVTAAYPDPEVIEAILGICQFGARIRYQGQHNSITIHQNLPTAASSPNTVTTEIERKLGKGRLESYTSHRSLPAIFTCSPLGLVDKADGSKRGIHHLSFQPSNDTSINSEIPEHNDTIS